MAANATLKTAAGATRRYGGARRHTRNGRQSRLSSHVIKAEVLAAMGEIGTQRCRHDDGERSADAQLHADFFRHANGPNTS
jgi:hypothetical protein